MKNQKMKQKTIKYAFRKSLPVMAGYLVLGTGFGILLQSKGYSWLWAFVMSLTIYAGSMQYLAIDLLGSGASLITVAIMTLMVNIRHIFYGITMLTKYQKAGPQKPYLIFALTDETFSLVCAPDLPEGVDEQWYDFWLSLFDQCYWIAGSVFGALLGSAIPFNSAGVEFSMTALFVVIFIEQWEKTKQHLPAMIGVVISVVSLLLFGPADFLIPAMTGITVALMLARNTLSQEKTHGEEAPEGEPLQEKMLQERRLQEIVPEEKGDVKND